MRTKRFAAAIVLGLLALLSTAVPPALADGPEAAAPTRHLVFTNGEIYVDAAVAHAVEQLSGRTLRLTRAGPGGMFVVNLPPRLAARLARVRGVLEVAPEPRAMRLAEKLPWGVGRMDADMVWSTQGVPGRGTNAGINIARGAAITGEGVTVAIMDSGIEFKHPDLRPNLDINGDGRVDAYDGHVSCILGLCSGWLGSGGDAIDMHGTHIAGIVAAADNDDGVIGVAPRAKLLSINMFEGGGYFSDVMAAYDYLLIRDASGKVVGRRADVANQSWGYERALESACRSCITALQAAVDEVWSAGIVLVAAAGNSGNAAGRGDNILFPARLRNQLAVAGTSSHDRRADFSSVGASLDVAAPGVNVLSTLPGGQYGLATGTSMASPHVAGTAALVIDALGRGWTPAAVVRRITTTADDLGTRGYDTRYGNGLVDAQEAATGVRSTP